MYCVYEVLFRDMTVRLGITCKNKVIGINYSVRASTVQTAAHELRPEIKNKSISVHELRPALSKRLPDLRPYYLKIIFFIL